METIRTKYIGDLRTEAVHIKSGVKIITDAPTDNQGKGESFSPSDLLAASLTSCILTIMGIVAGRNNINISGTDAKTTKIMANDPRRVIEVKVDIQFPENNFSDKEKKLLENAAFTCPVAKSLHSDIAQTITFNY
jgi:putative redox protein